MKSKKHKAVATATLYGGPLDGYSKVFNVVVDGDQIDGLPDTTKDGDYSFWDARSDGKTIKARYRWKGLA